MTQKLHPYVMSESAYRAFLHTHPDYLTRPAVTGLREKEYGRLDAQGHVYLDYTGGGLYAEQQLREHLGLMAGGVYGNPHSNNPTSQAMTCLVDEARRYVLEYFNAPPDEYVVIFTQNASGALKLVGEAYPFAPGGHYLLTFDNHNSVNGIREFARRSGAGFTYVPVTAPHLHIDMERLQSELRKPHGGGPKLFAFPAQSNFSGVQHPLELIAEARQLGWDVLVDCAAFAPTNRLDLGRWLPDFVPLSFYKMFGYPTGLGCLLARREALAKLRRPWYAGGTITISSVQGDGHYLAGGEAGFEDGTVDYLNIPAVEIGLRYLNVTGIDAIHDHVMALTGWLIEGLTGLRHRNGSPLVRIHGPASLERRGATVTASYFDCDGVELDDRRIEELANHQRISLRTGCFCNPGAGEVAHGLTPGIMREFFKGDAPLGFQELRQQMKTQFGRDVSAVRISVGIASNFADVDAFLQFAARLLDHTAAEIGEVEVTDPDCSLGRDSA